MLSTIRRPDTVPVCDRCRHRRQKCDQDLSGCGPCRTAKVECTFHDPDQSVTLPRRYVQELEERVAHLRQQRLARARDATNTASPVASGSVIASSIRLETSDHRYLGQSSGISFIRAAIDLAKREHILGTRNDQHEVYTDYIHDGLPELLTCLSNESASCTWPTAQDATLLFDIFDRDQISVMILTRSEFEAYQVDANSNNGLMSLRAETVLRLVFAIALHTLGRKSRSTTAAKSAEAFYDQAYATLPQILPVKDSVTLQIVLLTLHYSLASPTKPIIWHLLGHGLRLATYLGIHKAAHRRLSAPLSNHEAHHQRLFWSLYSMDRAVGNSLGRPTSLHDYDISVTLPNPDDSVENPVRGPTLHIFRLRQLQSDVAEVMYQRTKTFSPTYVEEMQGRIDEWHEASVTMHNDLPMRNWFDHAYYNLTMFLHRPSVARPIPSSADVQRCFEASSNVLRLYWKMHQNNSLEYTWLTIHWLFLAGITHLYCIWVDEDVRNALDWTLVYQDTQSTSMILAFLSERLKSAEKMPSIYFDLCSGTVRTYGELYPQSTDDEI